MSTEKSKIANSKVSGVEIINPDTIKREESKFSDTPVNPVVDHYMNGHQEQENLAPADTQAREILGLDKDLDFSEVEMGSDLDVPGSDLDDEREKVGNEDEENNYYSLGGDDHNDLEESQGN